MYRRRKSVDLNVEDLKIYKYSHVVVRIPPGKERKYVNIQIDMYSRTSRMLNFNQKTSLLKRLLIPKKPLTINSSPGDIRFYVKLFEITNAVNVEFKTLECEDQKKSLYGIVELIEPWNLGATQFYVTGRYEYITFAFLILFPFFVFDLIILIHVYILFLFFTFYFAFFSDSESKTLQIQTKSTEENNLAELRLTLDSTCSYSINIQKASLVEQISCVVRDRWTTLYPISISILLLAVAVRFDDDRDSLLTAGITIILCIGLGIILECCVVFIVLHLLAICVCCSVVFLGTVAHNIAVRLVKLKIIIFVTVALFFNFG